MSEPEGKLDSAATHQRNQPGQVLLALLLGQIDSEFIPDELHWLFDLMKEEGLFLRTALD